MYETLVQAENTLVKGVGGRSVNPMAKAGIRRFEEPYRMERIWTGRWKGRVEL